MHNTDTQKRRDGPEGFNVGVSAEGNYGDGKQTGRQGKQCGVWLGGKVGDPGGTCKKSVKKCHTKHTGLTVTGSITPRVDETIIGDE